MKKANILAAGIALATAITAPAQATSTTCRKSVDLDGPGFNLVIPVDKAKLTAHIASSGVIPGPVAYDPAGNPVYGVVLAAERHKQNADEVRTNTYSQFYVTIPAIIDGKPGGYVWDYLVNGDTNANRRKDSIKAWKKNWNFVYQAGHVELKEDYSGSPNPTALSPMGVSFKVSGRDADANLEQWLDVSMAPRWLDGKFAGQTSEVAGFTDLSGPFTFVPKDGIPAKHANKGIRFYHGSIIGAVGFTFLPKAGDSVKVSGRLQNFLINDLGAYDVGGGQPAVAAFNYFTDVSTSSFIPTPEIPVWCR